MRFLIDECVPLLITKSLQNAGYDVSDPRLQNNRGLSDIQICQIAHNERRIIITRDLDFNILLAKRFALPGIILLRFPSEILVETIVDSLVRFLSSPDFQLCEGNLVIITPGRIRIRPLRYP